MSSSGNANYWSGGALFLAIVCASPDSALGEAPSHNEQWPTVDTNGTVRIPYISVPLSRYMSDEAKAQFIKEARAAPLEYPATVKASIEERRAEQDRSARPIVERLREQYAVNVESGTIGGVPTQTITPRDRAAADDSHRVLINLHGGGFFEGGGQSALVESIPLSALGKFTVISVDYRMAPEFHFPAASEDVASVYSALLKKYPADDIGICGCSAGGMLAAMAIAWFQKVGLPTPGAVGIFHAGAYGSFSSTPDDPDSWGGDSSYLGLPLEGFPALPRTGLSPYASVSGALDYAGSTNRTDPLVSPALSPAIMARFPPTLLITGTRAIDMSAAVQTHRLLTKAGVAADLHMWDGMGHCFYFDTSLPESQEAYDVIVRFFRTHLGQHH